LKDLFQLFLLFKELQQICPSSQAESTQSSYVTSTNKNDNQKVEPVLDYRLPRNLKPLSYELLIRPYFNVTSKPDYYHGNVYIKFKCVKQTSKIVLHMTRNLVIDNSSLEFTSYLHNDLMLRQFDWDYDSKLQFLKIDLKKDLLKENQYYSIRIGFKGYLRDDNSGFYRSSYVDTNGQKRWLMTSQMEPTDARKSFPCFDEPDMKAKFKITVIHDESLKAMSNMPIRSSINL
jgi:aminopeptidase N